MTPVVVTSLLYGDQPAVATGITGARLQFVAGLPYQSGARITARFGCSGGPWMRAEAEVLAHVRSTGHVFVRIDRWDG